MKLIWLRHLSVAVVSTLFLSCGGGGGGDGGGGSPPPGGNPPPGGGMMPPPPPVPVLTAADLNAQRTPEFLRSFGLESVKTEYSLARGGTGKGVTIAILEVGNSRLYCADCFPSPAVLPSDRIYADLYWLPEEPGQPDLILHRELVNRRSAEPKLLPDNPYHEDYGSFSGENQHATRVTVIAAGEKDGYGVHGIAPEAQIRFLNNDRMRVAEEIAKLAGTVPIINNSWQHIPYRPYGNLIRNNVSNENLRRMIELALGTLIDSMKQAHIPKERRSILVLAAGNDFQRDPSSPAVLPYAYPDEIQPHSLVVAAVDFSDPAGPRLYGNACGVTRDYCLAAPGVSGAVWVNGNQRLWSLAQSFRPAYQDDQLVGTSYAAPLVSGALAVLKQLFPTLGHPELVQRLLVSADKSGPFNDKETYGQGLLDMDAATAPIGTMSLLFGPTLEDNQAFPLSDSVSRPGGAVGDALQRGFAGREITPYDELNTPFAVPLSSFTLDTRTRLEWEDNQRFVRHVLWPRRYSARDGSLHLVKGYGASSGLLWHQSGNGDPWLSVGLPPDYIPGTGVDSAFDGADGYGNPYMTSSYDLISAGYMLRSRPLSRSGLVLFTQMPARERETGLARGFFAFGQWSFGRQELLWQGGVSQEERRWLSSRSTGAFAGLDADTLFVGLDWQVHLGRQWSGRITAYRGQTRPTASAEAAWSGAGRLSSSAFSIGVERKNGITEGDRWGLRLRQPLRVDKGQLYFRLPADRTPAGALVEERLAVSAAPSGRELDLSLTYEVPGGKHSRWKMRLGAARQPGHTRTADTEVRALLIYQREL